MAVLTRRQRPEQVDVSVLVNQGRNMTSDDKVYVNHNEMVAILDAGGTPKRIGKDAPFTTRLVQFQGVVFIHACSTADACYDQATRDLFDSV